MPITIQSARSARFERRWLDYYETLWHGTHPEVGQRTPPPHDVRREISKILGRPSPTLADYRPSDKQLHAAEQLLDTVWTRDVIWWPARLQTPFLERLTKDSKERFGRLVKKGCQPDALAMQFVVGAKARINEPDQREHVQSEIREIQNLGTRAADCLKAWANRRRQLEEYFAHTRLRVTDDAATTELDYLASVVEEVFSRQGDDLLRVAHQLDGRRQTITGHALSRLSGQIRVVTGKYNDAAVEPILNDLRLSFGQPATAKGTLKKQRDRRRHRL